MSSAGVQLRDVLRYLLVVSEPDPVARRVAERWGTPRPTGEHVDGAAVRELSAHALMLRRPGPHVHDERLDRRLPPQLIAEGISLVFPSIHRSEQNLPCLTVHPLGNPGPTAEIGGSPRALSPTDPGLMVALLRRMSERAPAIGLRACYESTHHGPWLGLPSLFVEIGYGHLPDPPDEAVKLLSELLPSIETTAGDRIAVAVGGGHYAPHFTDLAIRRSWAFGHILSRHALVGLDGPTAQSAYRLSPGAEGIVYARAADAGIPAFAGLGPRLRESLAPERSRGGTGGSTDAGRPASGT